MGQSRTEQDAGENRAENYQEQAMTPDWERIRRDTERAIEHMSRLIEIAEAGKKRVRSNGAPAEPENDTDSEK